MLMKPDSSEAVRIVEKLRAGFPEIDQIPSGSYLVGGCVRDALMDRPALDVDFAASSSASVARQFASRVHSRPIQLGRDALAVWRVTARDRVYDFADIVGESIEADLGRRDFTINAMALELAPEPRLIDPFRGREDLRSRKIRIVSEKNIEEDPLRILRAVRFAVQLNFEIDQDSFRAMEGRSALLAATAPERVTYELDLILRSSQAARGVDWMARLGLSGFLFGLAHTGSTVSMIGSLKGDTISALYVLLVHLEDNEIEAYARRWRWSTQILRDLLALRRIVDAIRHLAARSLEVVLYDGGSAASHRAVEILRIQGMDEQAGRVQKILEARGASLFETEALLGGHEIQELAAVGEGAEVGRLKRLLLEAQIRGEVTTRDEAAAMVSRARS